MINKLFHQWSKRRLPQVNGRIYLNALQHPVSVLRDKWGVPHIYAKNRHDLFFAQGFVHAQDRLWQMELNRRAASGTLSTIFSKITLNSDRLSRTLGFRRLAKHNVTTLNETAHDDLDAYTKGVNAFLQHTPHLPIEFVILRHRPLPWQPVDTLAYGRLQMWALTHGAMGEWINAQLVERVGPEMAADLGILYPDDNPVTLPNGIEINRLQLVNDAVNTAVAPFMGKGKLDGAGRGSNAWVIAPARSQTGHAILCNDMHLPLSAPSLWHLQHLHSDDGMHVTGFTLPGMPYVLVGHNAQIAWGATLSYTDCEDLFVERFNPSQPSLYEFKGEWRNATVFQESISVRGLREHLETITTTHHGPIVSDLLFAQTHTIPAVPQDKQQKIALSSTSLNPDIVMDGFGRLNEAADWESFVTAVSHIHTPSLNLLYADRQGNIGHYLSGHIPIRAKGNGSLPAPGWTSTHEWTGTIPFKEMPHALNPQDGVLVSANHRIINASYPHHLGHNWRNGYRAARIQNYLNQHEKISMAHCAKLHLDFHHGPALKLISHLQELKPANANAALSHHLLNSWDGWLSADAIGGTVYAVFLAELTKAVLSPVFERPFLDQLLGKGHHPHLAPVNDFYGQWMATLLNLLDQPQNKWLPSGKARHQLFEHCLAATTQTCRRILGNNPAHWQWGKLHQVQFAHALAQQSPFNNIFNVGPFPIGGDTNTVAQTGVRPDQPDAGISISISSRHIVDLGNLSNSLFMHAPGQSGHLGSPHYADLAPLWRKGNYININQKKDDVVKTTHYHLTLKPT